MFHLTQKFSKGLWAFLAILVVTASLFSSFLATSTVHAADPAPKSGGCNGNGITTGLTSPFSQTPNMCIGDGQDAGLRYFQFAVKLNKSVPVTVTAKSGSGTSISFAKQSDTLYVSKPDSRQMGYPASVRGVSPPCNTTDKNNQVTITVKGPGSNNTDTTTINLCSYKGSASQSLIYYTSDVKDASGTSTATTGTILGNLGIKRNDPLVPDNRKSSTLNKDYVSSFVLTGPTTIKGDNSLGSASNGGFDLANGKLKISNLKPGVYELKITYNDKAAIIAEGGDAGWTTEHTYDFKAITVTVPGPTWIAGSSDSKVYYESTATAPGQQEVADDSGSVSTCVVEGVGWIVCPIMTFMGGIVDGAYYFVSGLLKVQPLVTTGDNAGVYIAWGVMRSIANVAFVIAFLIIIFSQLTGVGVSNYGVKKLLPRLVIAAILVNVSFWICAIGIDLSNIIGASVVKVFDSVGANISSTLSGVVNDGSNPLDGSNQWTNLVGAVLAGTAVAAGLYYVTLAALIPALLAALVAIVTVFLVLTLRQALIILLIVVAPLAFVAYLLPNTEDLFTKWRKLFMTLLLMYPIIAGIFGASALASLIIMNSAKDNFVVQIMGACIAILPLAITPIVMRTAGGVLNRFAGIVNNVNKGPVDRMKNASRKYTEDRRNLNKARGLDGGNQLGRGAYYRWRARRNAISSGIKNEMSRNEQQYVADAMTKGGEATSFANKVAGGTSVFGKTVVSADPSALQRALAGAKFTIEKAEIDDIKAEQSLISNLGMEDLQKSLASAPESSTARRAAIIDRMISIGSPEQYMDAVNAVGRDTKPEHSVLRRSVANSLKESGPGFLKASDIDNFATGKLTRDEEQPDGSKKHFEDTLAIIAQRNVAAGVLSEKKMVNEPKVNLEFALSVADAEGQKVLVETAQKLVNNEVLKGEIKHNRDSINKLVEADKKPLPAPQATVHKPTIINP